MAAQPLPQPVEAPLECSELLPCAGEDGSGSGVGGGGGGGGGTSDRSRSPASPRNLRRWCCWSFVVFAPIVVLAAFVLDSRRGRAEEVPMAERSRPRPSAIERTVDDADTRHSSGEARRQSLHAKRAYRQPRLKRLPSVAKRQHATAYAASGRHAGDPRLTPVVQTTNVTTAGQGEGEGEGGEEGEEGEEGGGGSLPQCFSSPDADPSKGAWTECEGGVRESPADMVDWVWDSGEYRYYQRCSNLWLKDHAGEGPMPHWKWKPDDCSLEEVDAGKFCRVMEGRKGILFVGDSLTRIMASTLASVLRAEVRAPGDEEERVNGEARLADRWTACGGELNFIFIRNDFIDPRTVEYEGIHCEAPDLSKTRCVSFALSSILREADTLVLNSGAHRWRGGWEAYGDAMRVSSASLTASMRSLHGDDAILVVRNTVPGHWGCEARMFEGPVSAEVATSLVAAGPERFQWDHFHDNNRVLEEAFTSTGGGWRVLDAYTPTLLRADLHHGSGDCLHYCVPGPIDHWVTLLYNILLVETAEKS